MKKALSYNPSVPLKSKDSWKTNDSYKMPSQWVQRFLIKYRVQAKVIQKSFWCQIDRNRIPIKMGNPIETMIPSDSLRDRIVKNYRMR